MSRQPESEQLVTVNDLRGWFQESVRAAMDRNAVRARDSTGNYVCNLLMQYSRSENLYQQTEDEGRSHRPLAMLYREAMESGSEEIRRRHLQRLGDLALFVAGFFAESLERKPVDVDYYAGMGGAAYSSLADTAPRSFELLELNEVYRELAEKFTDFIDVLAEVSEMTRGSPEQNALRLYETWLRTGSERARRKLEELGIHPHQTLFSRHEH